jgi:hypothetical protein
MSAVYLDPPFDDSERRGALYAGELLLLSARRESEAVVAHAREMLEAAFPDGDPRMAQHRMAVEAFAEILIKLKPAYIHHPQSWGGIAAMLVALGCDPEQTYLDVPRLRISTSHGYLVSGVAYAHHPHRDTWWAAPLQQLNWWMPLYDFESASAMAFHPRYWSEPTVNDSHRFSYFEWNTNQRKNASQHVTSDTRWQPHATEPVELEPEIRLVCRPGAAIVFSGAQLHSTVANTSGRTRFSIDFRTVNLQDVIAGRGAPNVDSAPRGTSLRDFKRLSDGERVPEDVAARFGEHSADDGALVFAPTA